MRTLTMAAATFTLSGCFLIEEPQEQTQTTADCSNPTGFNNRILCEHNDVRQSNTLDPQPSPALADLTWSNDLANLAQNYAEECIWEHNENRGDGFNVNIGENLYAQTNAPDPETAVVSWAEEIQHYDYDTNSCATGEMCGHYTQVVWRNTTEVGCGQAFCSNITNLSNQPGWGDGGYIVVCNYAPAGNIIGQQPY